MIESVRNNLFSFNKYRKVALKSDILAAIVVFLVAIPLCLGIALASGAPLFSGILSGIIGGIVVGIFSASQASVSGPAAGMAAVVVTAIAQLGDFNTFLLALTFAGLLQILIGIIKGGVVADYIPSNVIQGLLCAIGILLIIKQLPLAFTHASTFNELKASLLESTEGLDFVPLYNVNQHLNGGAILISMLSLGVLLFFEKTKNSYVKSVPAPIVVVILGILINELFNYTDSRFIQDSSHLVYIPSFSGMGDFLNQLQFPNWAALTNHKVYIYAAIIAIVASLESLLNIKAIENLDKRHQNCPTDRELIAQGIGNVAAGLIGGIPITSVIVRSSINIEAGSKSKMSTILHGFFIAIAVILLPDALNKIPLSSLAALLIFTGYKLTKPSIFKQIYKQGWDRFIPFIVTVVSIVIFNLLAGILIGLATSLFYILKSNSLARLDIFKEIYPNGVTHRLILPQQMTFLNKASFVAELNAIPQNSQLIIDARHANYIDKEIIELMHRFKKDQAPSKKIALNLVNFKDIYHIHNYIDFINVTTYDIQTNLLPEAVLNILHEGNQRFLHDRGINRQFHMDIQHTADAQHPIAVVLGCIDSRVPVETIFDMTFGDLFCVRVAGNVINNDVLASMEYACDVVKAKLIVVLGHTRCGAIQAACDGIKKGHITQLLEKIQPAIEVEKDTMENRNGKNLTFVSHITDINVANTLKNIYERSKILKDLINRGEIGLVGAVYNVSSGVVHFKDYCKILEKFPEQDAKLIESLSLVLKNAGL